MAFNDLLSTSFLFSIAIIIILIGGIFAYVSFRMSEQDHKITSMVGLISTMAEELHFFRSKLNDADINGSATGYKQESVLQEGSGLFEPVLHTFSILESNNLISVSDDDESESDDSESGSESGSESDNESDNESDSDNESEPEEYKNVSLEETMHKINDIDEIDEINDIDEIEDLNDSSQTNNIKSIHLEEPIELNVLESGEDLLASDLKTISIMDLEDTNKKTDYKKMSINKLREVVVEKGIIADATKLKKNDLLKLLGDE